MDGCSVQYAENSVRDVVPRMNGGAVKDERSPLKDAIDWRYHQRVCKAPSGELRTFKNVDHEPLFWGATPSPSPLEELDMACDGNNEWLRVS